MHARRIAGVLGFLLSQSGDGIRNWSNVNGLIGQNLLHQAPSNENEFYSSPNGLAGVVRHPSGQQRMVGRGAGHDLGWFLRRLCRIGAAI
jgi:hypothetical protein